MCWSGNDDEAHKDRYVGGATGVISVTSNVAPALMHKLMHGGEDAALDAKLQPLIRFFKVTKNKIGKEVLTPIHFETDASDLKEVFLEKKQRNIEAGSYSINKKQKEIKVNI